MANLYPDTQQQSPADPDAPWRKQLTNGRSYILTVVATVVLTLLAQAVLPGQLWPGLPSAVAALRNQGRSDLDRVSTPALLLTPETLSSLVAPAPAVQTESIPIEQQIAELHDEINRLWSAYYLARAASQIADAEAALRINNLSEVELVLTTVGSSLDRAYERSAEQEKGPISEFRMQVGTLYEDLRVRPEGMDQRLRRLRQSMLSLVDEGS